MKRSRTRRRGSGPKPAIAEQNPLDRGRSSITPTTALSLPHWPSDIAANRPAYVPRRDRSGIALITPCVKASLPLWNVNCSTVVVSVIRLKREWPSSDSSKAGITLIVGTQPWATNPPLNYKKEASSQRLIRKPFPIHQTGATLLLYEKRGSKADG